ncbi:hypothetical protein [Streptomyces wuyuanensis]|uniref:hypothetical protein n=1 Tax=Streptomyces wuyuanensis TaxID=1196353 RepID=UPI00343168B5
MTAPVRASADEQEVIRLTARVLELEELLVAAQRTNDDLKDLLDMARSNVEREQREHAAYRAAHKGSCTHPGCRLRVPHGHSEAARP